MDRCTREAEVIAEVFLGTLTTRLSPLRLERIRRNTLALTRTTQNGARSLYVNSVACAVAVRVVDDAGVEKGDAKAAARSRRAMERCCFLHRTAASELIPTSEIPLGVIHRALSRASGVFLGARKHRTEARRSTSSPHQKYRSSSFARVPNRSHLAKVSFVS